MDSLYALLAAPEADAALTEMAEAGETVTGETVKAALVVSQSGETVTRDSVAEALKLAEKRKAAARKAKAVAKEEAERAAAYVATRPVARPRTVRTAVVLPFPGKPDA